MNPDAEQLSEHFNRSEFACKGLWCCDGSAPIALELPPLLEQLRAELRQPLVINSGFRCRAHNAATAGASPNSQHCLALAVDVIAPGQTTPHTLASMALALKLFSVILWYPARGIVHLDIRKGPAQFREISP